jgi:hypothetical protein
LSPPTEADEVNSSLCHGFIFDFCGVEVYRVTGAVRVDKYVTMHDCGRVLHPGMVAGQITGGFAQGIGAALYEEFAYSPDGAFLAGTFADYLLPTSTEVPVPVILHVETPSPFTPLGAKGVGEGNCMHAGLSRQCRDRRSGLTRLTYHDAGEARRSHPSAEQAPNRGVILKPARSITSGRRG